MIGVVDYSALTSGSVRKIIPEDSEIIVPISVLLLLEKTMREKKAEGFVGMNEVKKLVQMHHEGKINLRYAGTKPRFLDREEVDFDAREIAKIEGATLITTDEVQERIASALGVDVLFIKLEEEEELEIEKFFDKQTMSIHIKENLPVYAKVGHPGSWEFKPVTKEKLSREEVEKYANEIVEKAEENPNAFIEMDAEGATVVQYGKYRIVITRPPFSKGIEITAVRPVVKLKLEDYNLPEELIKRFEERAEGIVIAGSPGAGKTTFAQALAEYYARKGKIVKTIEHPRDLDVMWEITQYGHLEGEPEKTGEILLLVRPDYTVYDELRTTRDFQVYADLRLAGVGMIGVTHASRAIDAIQRFLGRLELGVVPQVLDTVIYIKGGKIDKVYELELTVKVPSGMTEADLARPVVEVRDFFTKKLEYEIYAYGEETTIVPVKEEANIDPVKKLASKEVAKVIRDIVPGSRVHVDLVGNKSAIVYVDEKVIPHVIGKGGRTIDALEKKLGLSIDVKPIEEAPLTEADKEFEVDYDITEDKNTINFFFNKDVAGRQVDFYIDDEYLFSAVVSKKGRVRVGKKTEVGKKLEEAIRKGKDIKVVM